MGFGAHSPLDFELKVSISIAPPKCSSFRRAACPEVAKKDLAVNFATA